MAIKNHSSKRGLNLGIYVQDPDQIQEAAILTIEELKNMKLSLGLTNQDISDKSGVPLGTVQKIFANVTSAPRRKTLLAIEKALKSTYSYDPTPTAGNIRESEFSYYSNHEKENSYDRQGSYTVDDYYALPEDRRVELIDGYIYDMTAPTSHHQTIALHIASQILPCAEEHKKCQVLISPIDVQLDCDNRTMVQPDVVILCDPAKNLNRCIYGAPDFVLEVLSPSTRKKDMFLKLHKYADAGCREYWIVDEDTEHVIVYLFGDEPHIHMYTFNDKIPVGISEGKYAVDFGKIKERLTWGQAE